ncbi:F0F1 ATP synthase subunit A [Candidatus Saccharibacteria bacterium]|nr:F0F1 ATP synthase subunit A [Candidatus Saccharibacteria bacterium]
MIGPYLGLVVSPLAAEKLFSIGPLPITNSMIFGLAAAMFTLLLFALAARWSQLYPKSRLAYWTELLVDGIYSIAIDSFGGDRKAALKHLPLLVTLFTFIFIGNLSGLLPGVGTVNAQVGGEEVPLLRAFTTDLNATLAMAILTIGLVQFYAIRELGIVGHLKHYFSDKPWLPVNFFIGFNEVFSELLRIVTLSMRLFGVIYAGEVLISAIGALAGNFAPIATLPAVMLELFFSGVQAYIFMMLTATYLSIATANAGSHEGKSSQGAEPLAAT